MNNALIFCNTIEVMIFQTYTQWWLWQEQEEEEARQALEAGVKEPTMSLADAEQNLAQTVEGHRGVERALEDRLLAQTDDAKVRRRRSGVPGWGFGTN